MVEEREGSGTRGDVVVYGVKESGVSRTGEKEWKLVVGGIASKYERTGKW